METIAGVIIISGVLIGVAAMLVSPRVYQEPSIEVRLGILEAERGRWLVSQFLFALGGILPATGFTLLAATWLGSQPAAPLVLGAAAFLAGGLAGAIFVYRQTFDPGAYWRATGPIPMIVATVMLSAAGLGLFGLVFLRAGYPAWLAWLMMLTGAVVALVFLVRRGGSGFWLSVVLSAVELVAGFTLLLLGS